ncbi:MAG: hypothetical protein QNJ45_08575 [Ardenticatenaceae bacterium]|nr:hypothetical protein [Ardenticatenaceae bacterium]
MLTPAYKLTFGREAEPSGGLAGAVSGALSGATGGKVIDTTSEPQASIITELTVCLDLDSPADSFTLILGQVGSFRPQRDEEITVALGYTDEDELTQVMKGGIVSVESGLSTSRIIGHSACRRLLLAVDNQTFENKTAAQIVRELCDGAGVSVAKTDTGITFPAYVIDGRRDLYRHLQNLADLSGLELYFNPEGELVMEKFTSGNTIHVLKYAEHIIAVDQVQIDPQAGEVVAFGESPAGGQAAEAWAWLTKDFSGNKGRAGTGNPPRLLERPVLRTAEAAQTAAESVSHRSSQRTVRGRLKIAGRPQIKLGDAVRLTEIPEESLNGDFQVRSVTHRLSKRCGFTTTLTFQGTA